MLLKDICVLYMASPMWTKLKPNSRQIYMKAMEHFAQFMSMDADDITRPMIIDFKDKMYHRRGTCVVAISVLSNILSFAYDRGLVTYNHAARVRGMPKKIPWKRWNIEEVEEVLKVAPQHLQHVIVLALYTGQRRSDIARMRWDQYDGKYIHIIQQKTGKRLSIPVHPELKKWLKHMKAYNPFIDIGRSKKVPCPYILTNQSGQPWSLNYMTSGIGNLMRGLGYKERQLHGLRKTTASKLAELGCSMHEIAAITGQSLAEVEHYTREANQKTLAERAMKRWEDDDVDDGVRVTGRSAGGNVATA